MASKLFVWLALLALLAVALAAQVAPVPAYGGGMAAQIPAPTSTPSTTLIVKLGSNANLVIGALVLVVIIFIGVALNIRRKKL